MRIGILGGTFDPIHKGHLYLARKVLQKLILDKVIFIPTYLPPHKKNISITPTIHRYNMVKLAIANKKRFEVSDIEVKRKDRSYSVKTMHQLRKMYGPSAKIFFITGSDSLKDLNKWKDLKEILKLCTFVVVKRPRFAIKDLPYNFIILHIDAKDISATDIRRKIKRGQSINKLVPEKIRNYINRNKLYSCHTAKNI